MGWDIELAQETVNNNRIREVECLEVAVVIRLREGVEVRGGIPYLH